MRFAQAQSYRGHAIRRTYAGYSVESPDGVHITTAQDYAQAIQIIDARITSLRVVSALISGTEDAHEALHVRVRG